MVPVHYSHYVMHANRKETLCECSDRLFWTAIFMLNNLRIHGCQISLSKLEAYRRHSAAV